MKNKTARIVGAAVMAGALVFMASPAHAESCQVRTVYAWGCNGVQVTGNSWHSSASTANASTRVGWGCTAFYTAKVGVSDGSRLASNSYLFGTYITQSLQTGWRVTGSHGVDDSTFNS